MSEKKNIENLFREKFNDFEIVPDEQIWNNIEIQLKEKREKRRIIPFWWKLSGIAASLLLGFFITNTLFFSKSNGAIEQNNVVNQDKKNILNTTSNSISLENKINQNKTIVSVNASSSDQKNKNEVKDSSIPFEKKYSAKKARLANALEEQVQKNNLATTKKQRVIESEVVKKSVLAEGNNQIANTDSLEKEIFGNKRSPLESSVVNSDKENPLSQNSNIVIATTLENKLSNTKNIDNLIVVENNTEEIKNIDTTKNAVVSNALEELLKEKETKKKAGPKLNRWQIATNVAPIYFSSTSGGSPLDSRFESNDKDFQPSYSYGLGINYALNKKWSIKTGVNSLAFEYNTNGVVIYQNVNAREIKHVSNNLQGSLLQVENKSNSDTQEVTLNAGIVEKFDGSINQKMGYIEIPVEVGYKIIDKKFGVEVITGISSLLLNQNAVSVVSSGQSITIGEANNLNDFHFSGNLGIGFRYLFWKSFNANVNPMFKYQINTFNTDSGNFKPYVFGLYTGISYTF